MGNDYDKLGNIENSVYQTCIILPREGCKVLWWACLFIYCVTPKQHSWTSIFLCMLPVGMTRSFLAACNTLCSSGFVDDYNDDDIVFIVLHSEWINYDETI